MNEFMVKASQIPVVYYTGFSIAAFGIAWMAYRILRREQRDKVMRRTAWTATS